MQICSRLLKHLKLSRSPRFNYTFLSLFVRDDFLAIFFLSKHFPLTFCAQGFWKIIFCRLSLYTCCANFSRFPCGFDHGFQKNAVLPRGPLGKGPFWQHLNSDTVFTGALQLSRLCRLVLGPDRAKIPFPTLFLNGKTYKNLGDHPRNCRPP